MDARIAQVKRHKGEMAHAVYPRDVCAALLDRFPASKDAYIVVTATQVALDLDRTTAEVMKCFERNLEDIEGRMFELGINAKVKPARVIMNDGGTAMTIAQMLEEKQRLGLRRCGKCWEWRKAGVVTGGELVTMNFHGNPYERIRNPRLVKMPSKVAPWVCEECR